MLTIRLESTDSFALAVDPSYRKSIRLRAQERNYTSTLLVLKAFARERACTRERKYTSTLLVLKAFARERAWTRERKYTSTFLVLEAFARERAWSRERKYTSKHFSRLLTKCLANRLPVRRVDCRANESIDSSRIESNRRHFLPSLEAGLPCFN